MIFILLQSGSPTRISFSSDVSIPYASAIFCDVNAAERPRIKKRMARKVEKERPY